RFGQIEAVIDFLIAELLHVVELDDRDHHARIFIFLPKWFCFVHRETYAELAQFLTRRIPLRLLLGSFLRAAARSGRHLRRVQKYLYGLRSQFDPADAELYAIGEDFVR